MNVKLEVPTNRTESGPIFRAGSGGVVVEYDYRSDDGKTSWVAVLFSEVLHFEYRQIACCDAEDVIDAREIAGSLSSDRLKKTIDRWQKSVGWQEWNRRQGGATRFKHFKIFFDDAGCVDVVAASCEVRPRDQAIPTQEQARTQ